MGEDELGELLTGDLQQRLPAQSGLVQSAGRTFSNCTIMYTVHQQSLLPLPGQHGRLLVRLEGGLVVYLLVDILDELESRGRGVEPPGQESHGVQSSHQHHHLHSYSDLSTPLQWVEPVLTF